MIRSEKKKKLTHERLRELLHYDRATGVWTRLVSTSSRARAGAIAGCIARYRVISIDGCLYCSAPLAWFYVKGEWSKLEIDHNNLDKADDRWENLREATHGENQHNRRLQKNSSTGYIGVSIDLARQCWSVSVKLNGKDHKVRCRGSLAEAAMMRAELAQKLHGDFAHHETIYDERYERYERYKRLQKRMPRPLNKATARKKAGNGARTNKAQAIN
jgi:hypothetical protein